ncbi:MAG: hypothetical protein E7601_06225 [Ruminococcaceae bacterium]|nr:hypothetical protein [Oscillospiraceae bacterium]
MPTAFILYHRPFRLSSTFLKVFRKKRNIFLREDDFAFCFSRSRREADGCGLIFTACFSLSAYVSSLRGGCS